MDPTPGAQQSMKQFTNIGYEGDGRGQKGVIRMSHSHFAPQCVMLMFLPSKKEEALLWLELEGSHWSQDMVFAMATSFASVKTLKTK